MRMSHRNHCTSSMSLFWFVYSLFPGLGDWSAAAWAGFLGPLKSMKTTFLVRWRIKAARTCLQGSEDSVRMRTYEYS